MKTKVETNLYARCAIILLLAAPALAQSARLEFKLDHLANKAAQSVTVTLDKSLLELVAKFLPGTGPDITRIRKLIQGLEGVYVRSFEFDKEGQYSAAEVEAVRKQMKGPGWKCLVEVRNRKEEENVDVCLRQDGEKILGLGIVASEPKELTVVNIAGTIRPEDLTDLEGIFKIPHIPTLEGTKDTRRKLKEREKQKEKEEQDE